MTWSDRLRRWLVPPQVQYGLRALRGEEPRVQRLRFAREVIGWLAPIELQFRVLALAGKVPVADLRRNAALADSQSGRCFIIGNGPSLKQQDLKALANEFTIGANSFYRHPDADAVGLDILCIGDPSFWEDTENNVEWHRIIEERLPRTRLMFHGSAKALVAKHGLYAKHGVHYFARGITTTVPELINVDFTRPINVGATTGSTVCIPLAMYLGFSEIILLGFDANWLDNYNGSYHFYDKHEQHPQFDSLAADKRSSLYEEQLISVLREFEAHRALALIANRRGVRICNATTGGNLDVYERVRYEDILA